MKTLTLLTTVITCAFGHAADINTADNRFDGVKDSVELYPLAEEHERSMPYLNLDEPLDMNQLRIDLNNTGVRP